MLDGWMLDGWMLMNVFLIRLRTCWCLMTHWAYWASWNIWSGYVCPPGFHSSNSIDGLFWQEFFWRILPRWWFQTFFIFTPIWGRFPFWLIFFRWVATTNQLPFCKVFCRHGNQIFLSQLGCPFLQQQSLHWSQFWREKFASEMMQLYYSTKMYKLYIVGESSMSVVSWFGILSIAAYVNNTW